MISGLPSVQMDGTRELVLNPGRLSIIYKSMKKTDCEKRIEKLDQMIAEESAGDEEIERLQSIPGVGPKVAFAFVSHVGVARFENSGQLCNYLGLVPRVYMSGDTVRYGPINKRENSYVRALLVQGSWALVRSKTGGKSKELYEYMTIEKR